jgi:hypothetical protein
MTSMPDEETVYPDAPSDDIITAEDERIIDRIAQRVSEKIGASVIPSAFPAEVGEWIREACKYNASLWRHQIPMTGPTAMHAEYRLNPDGTMNLQFQDTNGRPFWNGTFRPAEP